MLRTLPRFRRPLRMLRRHWLPVLVGVVMVAGFCLCKIVLARLIGGTVDALAEPRDDRARAILDTAILWLVGLIVVEATCRYLARRLIIDSSRHIESRLKDELMAHIGRLPLAWYDRAQTGDLLSRLTQDVELLRFLVGPTILYGAQALVMVPGCVFVMATLSPTVTLAICAAFSALLVAMAVLMPRLHRYGKAVQEDIAEISQHAQESFAGIQVLFHFARNQVFAARFARLGERYVTDNMAMTRFRALLHLFVHFCTDMVLLSVLVFGTHEVIAGRMSTGDLFQFLILMSFLVWPLIACGWILGTIHRARSAVDRIEEVLAAEPEPGTGECHSLRGDLSVRGLTFRYPGETEPALRDLSFELAAGQKLGLVGAVGSGKSTLLHLILRLYDPPRGTIFVDGRDVLDLQLTSLRALFAFAPQEPFLFSDTVADNVRFGKRRDPADLADDLDEPSAELLAAVRSSALEQDVESLAEGLQTVVGERGVALSGGQKQRVALARALIADRGAVLLDDTLSAVDQRTEVRILDRLQGTARSRTLIVASHRLSAVADADLILVLADGAVAERGRHRELLARGGLYAATWNLQREERALGGEA